MRSTTAGEQTILNAKNNAFALKVEIKNAAGAYVAYDSLSSLDWQDRCEITQDANGRVAQATISIAREGDGNSLAPLINADIDAGRDIRISGSRVAIGSAASFKVLFEGEVDRWDCNADPMVLVARDGMGLLADRWVEEETIYGTDAGRAIEYVMQDILDGWADGMALYTPTAPGFAITSYRQQKEPVLTALQTLADLIGWVLEYRWDDSTSAFRLTFYEPDRTPAATVWDFDADDYYDVTRLAVDRLEVRNAIAVRYTDATTGERSSYETSDSASITKYGRRWMEINESDASPIDSDAEAQTLADAALSDLATPVAEQEIETDLFWPIQMGDFYGFTANDVHYDTDQDFAVTGFTHLFERGSATTRIQTRGAAAVSHTRGWIKREKRERPPAEVVKATELLNFREISRTTTEVTYTWDLGTDLHFCRIYDYTEEQPYVVDQWPADADEPQATTFDRTVTYTVSIPEQGFIRYFQVEGRTRDGSFGDMERVLIFPLNVASDYIAYASCVVNQSDGSAKITGWTTDRALSVAYAYNVGTASVSAPTEAQAEAQGTGATGGGLVTGFTSDFEISLAAGTLSYGQTIKGLLIAYINAGGTGPDGTAQDHDTPVGFAGERFKIESSDQITDGVVISQKLTESSRDFNFPATTFSASDWDTVAWAGFTLTVAPSSSYTINAGSVDAASDSPVYIYFDPAASTTVLQTTTSSSTATGERKLLLCVMKRASASNQLAFFVPAVGVFGINETVIGANSISTAKIQALAIEAGNIAAGAVTAAKISVASLSAISADCGTITAGTISTSVLVASQKLTASAVRLLGDVKINGTGTDDTNESFRFQASGLFGAAKITFKDQTYRTGGYIQGTEDEVHVVSDGEGVLIGGSGDKVGFYGTTQVAQQTGVAVTAAGIHAALVNLGLITA